jgi:hypothetical protein
MSYADPPQTLLVAAARAVHKKWRFHIAFVCVGRMGKVVRLWLSFTLSQRARVLFPGRARSTKPSIPPGSVKLIAASKKWVTSVEDCDR